MAKQKFASGVRLVPFVLAALLLPSCSIFRPEEPEDDKKSDRYRFLRSEERPVEETKVESIEEELVNPGKPPVNEEEKKRLEELSRRDAKAPQVPVRPAAPARFYDDFILLNGDEELEAVLYFNSAPLLDVLPAFADILGFNFIADSDLKGVVTLNLNSKMTRRELWSTFERMLFLAGAGATVEESQLKIMALPKFAQQPEGKLGREICYYPLQNSTAKDVVAQIKPFVGKDCVVVELTRPNALLIADDPLNLTKVRQLLDAIDQSGRRNWPRVAISCRNVLPARVVEELKAVLPVLGFTVTQVSDRVEQPGAVQLLGIDRLQLLVVAAATTEALEEIRKWVEIFDSSDSIDQERVFVYKVSHGKAQQLAQALSVIYNTQGSSYTIDTTTGNSRTDNLVTTGTANRTATTSGTGIATTAAGATANRNAQQTTGTNTQTDRNSNIFETPVKIFSDGVLNRLVVRTTPRTYASIKALLDRLDVVPSQVLLQVLVVEVTLTESTQFGLEFSAKGSGSGVDSLLGTNFSNLTPFGDEKQDGFTSLIANANDPENKFGYIRAMAGNTAIKVVSSPQLLVSSHTEAKIQVGSDVPIIVGGTTNSSGQVTQTYDYRNTGIILTITPQITSTNLISLNVVQELSNAVKNTTSTAIDSPEITMRNIDTAMTIANGKTMIIGGLIQEKRNDVLQSVPIINNIPFLRRIFGSTDAKVERSEILVMITGYIVNEKSPIDELIKRYNDALHSLNEFDETLGENGRPTKSAAPLDTREFWR